MGVVKNVAGLVQEYLYIFIDDHVAIEIVSFLHQHLQIGMDDMEHHGLSFADLACRVVGCEPFQSVLQNLVVR